MTINVAPSPIEAEVDYAMDPGRQGPKAGRAGAGAMLGVGKMGAAAAASKAKHQRGASPSPSSSSPASSKAKSSSRDASRKRAGAMRTQDLHHLEHLEAGAAWHEDEESALSRMREEQDVKMQSAQVLDKFGEGLM